jgi:hypothetical protein
MCVRFKRLVVPIHARLGSPEESKVAQAALQHYFYKEGPAGPVHNGAGQQKCISSE